MTNQPVRVVMIDDDPDDFEIVRGLLERGVHGTYKLIWMSTYEEGLESLNNQDGDVFLLDYNLGEKTGLDLLNEAGGKNLLRPVIMLTGIESPEVDLSAMEAGASYYISKASLIVDHLLERTIRYSIERTRDFNEIRNVERLRAEKEAALAASEAKNLFVANVGHELRTPLSAVLGFSEMALGTGSSEEKDRALSIIKRNAEHLLVLVNDLLDLSKLEAGKYEPAIAPCSWRTIVREVIETLQLSAHMRKNFLVFLDDPNIPEFIKTDAHWLRQILINLIGNAIKFTEGGIIEIRPEQTASFRLFVKDTGIGISEEERNRIFRPFAQGGNDPQRKFGGTGLGLHLSKQIAESLGGSLNLTSSDPGQGSTFCVNLPAASSN